MAFDTSQKEALIQLLQQRPEIIAAYLFGSQATRRTSFSSDIDIAVLVESSLIKEKNQAYGYRAALLTDLIKILKTNDVDLVILNKAPPLLKFQVIHHGDLLFSRSESQRIAFQIKAFNEYQDIRPMLAVQHAYLRRRLQKSTAQEGRPW